jgi:hypothetical protein
MKRRQFLFAATAFVLLSTTAARADYVEAVVASLKKQGYSDIEVTRTLLGRVKIVALKGDGRREMICNPRTGEILRDVWFDAHGDAHPPLSSTGSSSGSGSGSGESSGDDDDDDDNGDDKSGRGGGDVDEDDDNSGQGGGDDSDDDDDDDKSGKDDD